LNDSESAAAGAGEREKRAWQKLQAANTRLAATTAALDALKTELADANAGQWAAQLRVIACPCCSVLAPDSQQVSVNGRSKHVWCAFSVGMVVDFSSSSKSLGSGAAPPPSTPPPQHSHEFITICFNVQNVVFVYLLAH